MSTKSSLAVAHADKAAGAKSIQPGFAYDSEQDLYFAMGWPHMRFLVDDHPDDETPEQSALKSLESYEGGYTVDWPRDVATRMVRALGRRRSPGFTPTVKDVTAALAKQDGPITEAEGRELIAKFMKRKGYSSLWWSAHFVLLLEAMIGTEAVLDELVDAVEAIPNKEHDNADAGDAAYQLGFLLLRVPPSVAKPYRERLEAVVASELHEYNPLRPNLGITLGGGAAAKSHALNPIFYLHVDDDPDAIAASVTAGKWLPSTRLVFLGGERILEIVAPHWKKQKAVDAQRYLVEQLAEIQLPTATTILEEMAKSAKSAQVRKASQAALDRRSGS